MKTNYKWIFWDNDGVLVDTEKLFFQANREILSSIDIDLTREASDCLVIEDSERGLSAAKAAGIKCIVIPNGFTSQGDFGSAYRILDNVHQVVEEVLG